MEEAHALADLAPGGEHRHDAEQARQRHHQQAQAVHRQMKMDVDAGEGDRNPFRVEIDEPRAVREKVRSRRVFAPELEAEEKIRGYGGKRNPPGRGLVPPRRDPGEDAAGKQNHDEPDENHSSSVFQSFSLSLFRPWSVVRGPSSIVVGLDRGQQTTDHGRLATASPRAPERQTESSPPQ